jgi:hypothetical protein
VEKILNAITRLAEFENDLKKLSKRYHSLDKDAVEFIEIYFKGDKENEDKERVLRHYRK